MKTANLRIALFSGNYNYVRDGANQALNRLMEYMLRTGANVRIYSPTTDTPAFEPVGDLVSLPSFAVPRRPEYRIAYKLSDEVRDDLEKFAPNIVHLSSPDFGSQAGLKWARAHNIPVIASVHTRFETYLRYYGIGFAEPIMLAALRRFYQKCDALIVPTEGMAQLLRDQKMNTDISIWSRGIDRTYHTPKARDMKWRRGLGIADKEVVICFLGRLVMEKGLDIFVEVIAELKRRNVAHKVVVIGKGPAQEWFASRMPGAIFVGHQMGADLSRAIASCEIFLNPSVTEAFGNVTLEAMANALTVVAAEATGSSNIVIEGETGYLVAPRDVTAYADRLQAYCQDEALRKRHAQAGLSESMKYDWDDINQTVADNYIRLVNQHSIAKAAA
jgi:phosphatidylinositol alpha 1,6-mannosyltransferase